MTELTLEALHAALDRRLASIESQLEVIRIRTDGLPLLGGAIESLRRETRLIKAAINDMGRTNITAGEVEALHEDVDRVQSQQMETDRRLATIERLLQERK